MVNDELAIPATWPKVKAPQGDSVAPPLPNVSDRWAAIGLAAALLIGITLRIADIGEKSVWLDEAFSVALARAPWTDFVHTIETAEANMSVYYLLLRFWVRLGHDAATVRLLSAVASIITIPILYALGSRAFGRRAGLAAALFFAIDPLQLAASQDARGYSLAVLFITCSTWAFVHIVVSEGVPNATDASNESARERHYTPQAFWCALYAWASALALYAHFYTGFVLLAQWLSLIARPPGRWWPRLFASATLSSVLLIPLALFFLRGPHGNLEWLGDAIQTGIPRVMGVARTAPGFLAVVAYGGLGLAVTWAAVAAVGSAKRRPDRWPRLLVLLWLVVPVAIPLAISIALKPVLDPRYLIVCAPAFSLAAASVLTQPGRGRWALAGIAAIVILGTFADWGYFAFLKKEDWRDATRELLTEARTGDVVVFYAPYVRRPFDFYADQGGRSQVRPLTLYPDVAYTDFAGVRPAIALGDAINAARATAPRAWIVISHTGSRDTACAGALDEVLGSTFPKVEERDYPTIVVRLYSRTGVDAATPDAKKEVPKSAGPTFARICPQS